MDAARHLPNLVQVGRIGADRRAATYERFANAAWAVMLRDGSMRTVEQFARPRASGLFYHPMFVRSVEAATSVHEELLGSLGAVRIMAPASVVSYAEAAADRIADLVGTPLQGRG